MPRISIRNIKKDSPPWLVNLSGSLTGITAVLLTMVNTMPASVPETVKEWALWMVNGLAALATVSAGASMLTKRSDSTDPKEPPPGPKP